MRVDLIGTSAALAFAAMFFYFRYRRQKFLHAERMAAIERNLPLPKSFFAEQAPNVRQYLLRGMVWLAVGLGTAIFFFAVWLTERSDPELLGTTALGAIPVLVGAAHLIYYKMGATGLRAPSPEIGLRCVRSRPALRGGRGRTKRHR